MLNFPVSLVKYSTPVLISTGVRKESSKKQSAVEDFFPKKESTVDKSVEISKWIEVIKFSSKTKSKYYRIWKLVKQLRTF